MNVNRGWLWAAFVAVIALVLVSTLVVDPTTRAALSVVAIAPLLFLTARVAKNIEQREAYQKRKFSKLRGVTDEFLMAVQCPGNAQRNRRTPARTGRPYSGVGWAGR
jgi:hypothetical protein